MLDKLKSLLGIQPPPPLTRQQIVALLASGVSAPVTTPSAELDALAAQNK